MSEKSKFTRVAEYLRGAPSKPAKPATKADGYVRGSSGTGTGMADEAVHAIRSRKQRMDDAMKEANDAMKAAR